MFGKRSFASSKDRSGKIQKQPKRSFRDASDLKQKQKKMVEKLDARRDNPMMESTSPSLTSAIVTVVVGPDQRLFAAHEDVLSHAPFFAQALQGQFFESANRRINLPTEEPEVFSCILEYLYKGDYYPRLVHDKRRQTWMLEGATTSPDPNRTGDRAAAVEPTFFHTGVGDVILRDTAVYCAADRYGLEELKKLSLRKQGLQSGIEVGTILRSARYAYENTPDNDSRLRAHYLALIIRSRKTFKRSGTMQMEMEMGGNCSLTCSWPCATMSMISWTRAPPLAGLPGPSKAAPTTSRQAQLQTHTTHHTPHSPLWSTINLTHSQLPDKHKLPTSDNAHATRSSSPNSKQKTPEKDG